MVFTSRVKVKKWCGAHSRVKLKKRCGGRSRDKDINKLTMLEIVNFMKEQLDPKLFTGMESSVLFVGLLYISFIVDC